MMSSKTVNLLTVFNVMYESSFIHSFNYVLSAYYMPGTALDSRYAIIKKDRSGICPLGVSSPIEEKNNWTNNYNIV